MLRYFRIPLLFLFLGSLLGVFLRWQFISPTPGIRYSYFLHGHSHIMFLGWIFNALYIAFCHLYIHEKESRFFNTSFIILQAMVVGMMISFPLQGYGFFSILFSTLHTLCGLVFIIKFFQHTRNKTSIAVWLARIALLFFAISTAGPFSLGYLMANGMGHTNSYFFSIYFYLHFQYNGFFLFAVFSLFFDFLERNKIPFHYQQAKMFGWLLSIACIPAYLLSVLWAKPGMVYNIIAGGSAVVQFVALFILTKLLVQHLPAIRRTFSKSSGYFLTIVLLAFVLKLVLQAASAVPSIAQMAYELRPVVIAYLHMVLIGIISLFLLVWYAEFNLFNNAWGKWSIIVFISSFLGLEMCLTVSPWWSRCFGKSFYSSSTCTFVFAVILSFSCFLLLVAMQKKYLTKIRL